MGCTTSRIEHLPAVALCHDRCKFLEEAICHCHALADATLAHLVSLQALASCIQPFFSKQNNHDPDLSDSTHHQPGLPTKVDLPEEKELNSETDFLHPIHTNYFSYSQTGNVTLSPPPLATSSAWDFWNFFETYQAYEPPVKEKLDQGQGLDEPILPNRNKSIASSGNAKSEEVLVPVSSKEQLKERVGVSVESLLVEAAASGNEVLKILDTRKFRSNRFSSKIERNGEEFYSSNVWKSIGSFPDERWLSMSSTLRKLLIWEKKLYGEVKAEERLRLFYAKKCRQMKTMVAKHAKANELDSHQTLLSVLVTNIRVAIQVVERTCIMINNLRDEDLWPLLSELMQKLFGMWKAVGEYHRSQHQAFVEPGFRFSFLSGANLGDANLEALIKLSIELQNMNSSFHNWITAQRGFISALNGWIMNPLDSEQELEVEVLFPFSAGRTRGLPAAFVICKKWSLAMDVISEAEVNNAMQGFFSCNSQLLEQSYICLLKQKETQGQDAEKRRALLEKELLRMQKQMEVQGKKKLLPAKDPSGGCNLPRETDIDQAGKSMDGGLESGLRQILMALERFSANMSQAYGEICGDSEHQKT